MYQFRVTYNPKGDKRKYKHAKICQIEMNSGDIIKDIKSYDKTISTDPNLNTVSVEIRDTRGKNYRFADFMEVRLGYILVNQVAEDTLKEFNISYKKYKTTTIYDNNSLFDEYTLISLISINENILDLDLSNIELIPENDKYVSKGMNYFSPLKSSLILSGEIKKKGIFRLKEFPNIYIYVILEPRKSLNLRT